jgi:hypothetical protein
MSLTVRARGGGRDPHRSFRRRRAAWRGCAAVATTAGLLCAVAAWGWLLPIVVTAATAVLTAAWVASFGFRLESGSAAPTARIALETGLGVTAVVGLIEVLGVSGIVLVLLVAASRPGLVRTARTRWLGKGHVGERGRDRQPRQRPEPSRITVALLPRTTEQIRSMPDDDLCLAWRRSYVALIAAGSARERVLVVDQRQRFLDELQRRSPGAFADWLDSGARAPGNPLPYLRRRSTRER